MFEKINKLNLKSVTLSKSDFKLGRNCLKKLWYKKQGYPTTMEGNEYMEMLADGGYMVGKMAQLLYDDGIEVQGNTKDALTNTAELLKSKDVVLFEAAIQSGQKLVRIDVLVKDGKKLRLIEVKSKSFSSAETDFTKSEWAEYIEDIAYQKWVLEEAYPDSDITCELLMPDKDKTTPIEGLISWFSLEDATQTGTFRNVIVNFSGNLKQLKQGHILEWVNVDEEVEDCMVLVQQEATKMLSALNKNVAKNFSMPVSIRCNGCEYTVADEEPLNGFKECWGKLAEPKPHILELGQLGNVNRRKEFKDGINELIAMGRTALYEIPVEYVTNLDPEKPYYNNRPLFQLTQKDEFMLKGFKGEIKGLEYPLHFIDFETSQMAIPYHAGMRPYGKVMFQWSCHTIQQPGAEPMHSEWINTKDTYPNMDFAHSLMQQIGHKGTIMTWSAYENTQMKSLKEVLEEKEKLDKTEIELLEWLTVAVKAHKDDSTRICDMNKLALNYYFHPRMGGRTSIKVTLPAVLEATKSNRIASWLQAEGLWELDKKGKPIDPYKLLPSIEILEKSEKVKDGSGAMRAYQDMLYGRHKEDSAIRDTYRDALLKYCKLDTLAMVVIWEHWNKLNIYK